LQAIFNILFFGPLAIVTVFFNLIQFLFSGFGRKRSFNSNLLSVNEDHEILKTLIKIRENEFFTSIIEKLGRTNDWEELQ
jgi:hypothetical protein